MEWSRVLLTLLGPFLWKRVASKRVAARRGGVGEHRNEAPQDNHHEQSDQDSLAPRVAEIHGPAQLDFGRLGRIAEQLTQVISERAGYLSQVDVARYHPTKPWRMGDGDRNGSHAACDR